MIHPVDTPRAGGLYRIVVYEAKLMAQPTTLPEEEVQGVIALSTIQVILGPDRRPTVEELLNEGAEIVSGGDGVSPSTRLYPLGTAVALAHILRGRSR
jgi:hypothetical protein